ncbi:MAG: leucine-rich repeat domain-containing protein [Chloroflexota bacterium]
MDFHQLLILRPKSATLRMLSVIFFALLCLIAVNIVIGGTWNDKSASTYAQGTYDCTTVTEVPQEECQALVTLYNGTDGESWTNNSNWLTTDTPCDWHGVSCRSGRLLWLNLSDNNLNGMLPLELGNFEFLTSLGLHDNQLTGPIPDGLSGLTNLLTLSLSNNQLTGTIPSSLSTMTTLKVMELNNNKLMGEIPAELGDLLNLEVLHLCENQLTGVIPTALSELSQLVDLCLHTNFLTGSVPPELADLTALESLQLQHNLLSEGIPPDLGAMNNLRFLYLNNNLLSGKIPSALANMINLEQLYLHVNQLSGEIPNELGNLTNLTELRLPTNELSGSIPSALGSLSKLSVFDLSHNDLSSTIPPELGNLPELTHLFLNNNRLAGSIPLTLGALSNLKELNLGNNQLSGSIPPTIGNLPNLRLLFLYHNQLTNEVPLELGNLKQLQLLQLHGNQLAGEIPTVLENLSMLKVLYLHSNEFTGTIPSTLGNLSQLEWLSVSDNQLTGTVPSELGQLSQLTTLWLSDNPLNEQLPEEFISLQALNDLQYDRTNICVPDTEEFRIWLNAIDDVSRTGLICPPQKDSDASNDCTTASPISGHGVAQNHNFSSQEDEDWFQFEATSNTRYVVRADIPSGSQADANIDIFDDCDGTILDEQDLSFAPFVEIRFTALTSGTHYLKLTHNTAVTATDTMSYSLSVRPVSANTPTHNALIVVAGAIKDDDPVQPYIYQVTDKVREVFMRHDYAAEQIRYLAADPTHEDVDAFASTANLEQAITAWAADKVSAEGMLTIYLMDHGNKEQIYLDKRQQQWVTPEQLDQWLEIVETKHPGLQVNIIIEACYSGSFISKPQTLSKPGRVIIASTNDASLAWTSREGGAIFSDRFLAELDRKASLDASFRIAQSAALTFQPSQVAWLDADGNGIPNQTTDYTVASQRGLGVANPLEPILWRPSIFTAHGPDEIQNGNGLLRARVQDDIEVKDVWAIIYPPSYRPPTEGEALIRDEDFPAISTVQLLADQDDRFSATFTGFDEAGTYRVVFYAEDDQDVVAQPVSLMVQVGDRLYLPLMVQHE